MRVLHSVVLAVGVSVGLTAAYNASQARPSTNPAVPPTPGRYQLHVLDSPGNVTSEFLIDTATGAVWSRHAMSNDQWLSDGNPTSGELHVQP